MDVRRIELRPTARAAPAAERASCALNSRAEDAPAVDCNATAALLIFRSRRALAVAAALVVAALCVGALGSRSATAAAPVAVYAVPPSVNVFIGGTPVQVEVWAAPIASPGMGTFQVDANFDSALMSLSVQPGPFLGSTGNTVACTTTYPSSSQIRLYCTATNHPSSGPTGSGVLAMFEVQPNSSLQIRAAANNAQITSLDLAGAMIRDVNRVVAPLAEIADAAVAVRALEGDVNADCVVDVADNDIVASHYPSTGQMISYDLRYDIEPSAADGDIDLRDLQFVFGRNGSTCGAPVPPQPPPDAPAIADSDADGVPDVVDNCPSVPNSDQANADGAIGNTVSIPGEDGTVPFGDAIGDVCSTDRDSDGLPDAEDVNPLAATGACAAFAGASDGHARPAGGDITSDDDDDGDPAEPMGDDLADDGPSWDTDNDGVQDGYECQRGSNPRNRASEPPPLPDDNVDSDGDGLLNGWERRGWGTDPGLTDSDGDGLGDCIEAADIDGNATFNSTGDLMAYAAAAFEGAGMTWDFDFDRNGMFNSTGDVMEIAQRVFRYKPCL